MMFRLSRIVWLLCLALACKIKKPVEPVSGKITDEVRDIYFEAETAYQNGNSAEAKILFTEFIKKSPAPAPAYYRLACIERNAAKTDLALDWIAKAQLADTQNYHYKLFEAQILQNRGQHLHAGEIYHSLALKYPSRWSFYNDGAKMFKLARENEKLIVHCNDWERAFGLREDMVQYRTEAYFYIKKYDEGLADWNNLIRKYPYRKEYKINYASMLLKAGRSDSAASVYRELLRNDPNNADVLSALCSYYQTTNKNGELWNHSKLVVKSTQLDIWKKHSCLLPFLNNNPGNLYYDSLENTLTLLTKIHPEDHRSWLFLADWYFARKEYGKAISGFDSSLRMSPNNYQVWNKFTECLDRCAEFDRLSIAAESMLALFPSNPTVALIAVRGYMGLGEWNTAKEHCQTGLLYALDDEIKIALNLSLARILNSLGEKNQSAALMAAMKNAHPDNSEIMNAQALIYAENNEKLSDALALINQALSISGQSDYHFTRSRIQHLMGDIHAAITSAELAVKSDPRGKYYEFLGDLYLGKGDKTRAIEAWNHALESGYRPLSLQNRLKK